MPLKRLYYSVSWLIFDREPVGSGAVRFAAVVSVASMRVLTYQDEGLKTMATKKAAAKKAPAKKAAAKKVTAKKAAPAKQAAAPAKKVAPLIKDKLTKTQIVATIAESTSLSKKQVGDVLGELESLMERSLKKRAVGEFTLPGLMKITTVKKPAKKARKGINPFTGEQTTFAAKPASVAVKVRPLKKMKDFADN